MSDADSSYTALVARAGASEAAIAAEAIMVDSDSLGSEPEVEIVASHGPQAWRPDQQQAIVAVPDGSDSLTRFDFGTNRGNTFKQVTEGHPGYFFWTLTQYREWVQQHYIIDHAVQSLVSKSTLSSHRAEPGEEPPPAPHKQARAAARREQKLRWSQTPKCAKCTEFSAAGSNAFQRRKTCVVCGDVTITKIERPKAGEASASSASCPHANTNRSGSTKTVSRIFCVDCQTYVHEEPQTDETRAAAKAASSVRRQAGGSARAEPEPRPDAQLTSAQALGVAKTFPTLVKAHVRKADDGVVTQRQLESMLSDAIDIVKDQDEGADPARPASP